MPKKRELNGCASEMSCSRMLDFPIQTRRCIPRDKKHPNQQGLCSRRHRALYTPAGPIPFRADSA
jgi:hypothetical protein